MTTNDPEYGSLHDQGDCTYSCAHPDHQYDDPFEVPTDVYDQIVRDIFELANRQGEGS